MQKDVTQTKIIDGIIFCAIFALISFYICKLPFFLKYNVNSLSFAIVLGIILGNVFQKSVPAGFKPGIEFSSKRILRLGIILYGFRITFSQVQQVGAGGLIADVIMLSTTYIVGYYVGTKVMKLDKDLCILTAIGSSVCGAAAVLGTDSILKAKAHKVSLAVATVVLFGTISMILYPLIYKLGFLTDFSRFGIYIGSCVHEVAQVVAAGSAISPVTMDTAVIVKLTRVMLLVPYLFLLSFMRAKSAGGKLSKIQIPWFAVLFVAVCGFNSLQIVSKPVTDAIVAFDVFLLTLVMFALGMETNWGKIKGLGIRPVILALIMFCWLVVFGFVLNAFIL